MMQYKGIFLVYFLTLFSYALCIQDEDNSDNENSFIDVHQHPKSSFSCEGKKVGEYYSDLATQCQLYYVCLPNAQLKLSPTSFACPNTTRFNQATRVCSPADQVYCNIAERYYENIHGGIDTKDQRPNLEYLGADFDKTPWQINKKAGKSLIVPLNLEPEYKVQTERPRLPSARTIPKENQFTNNNLAKADSPLHTSFSLTFNQPQNSRVVARTRASSTNSRRGSTSETLPNSLNSNQASNRFKPSTNLNTRSRLPIYSNTPNRNTILLQPSTIATTPPTTTTTTTAAPVIVENLPPKTDAKSGDYIYDYVEYDAPASNNGNNGNNNNNAQPAGFTANTANKPPSLPAIPNLDEATPNVRNTNAVSTSNSNLGSLFSSTISHQPLNNANQQQQPRISSTSNAVSQPTTRPTQRNNLPQSNYFNTNNPFSNNPFSSNPFASNPFASNSGSLSRQKREDNDETSSILKVDNENNKKEIYVKKEEVQFTCRDGKLPGVGYSDIANQCRSFHICLPVSKGKYKDYQLFCSEGTAYNQYTANCEQIDKFDCKRSRDYYLYNKQVNLDSYLKNKFRISKQLADIKN